MGWRFPKRRVRNDGVLDEEDFSDSVRPVVEELSGKLDEHNFDRTMRTGLDQTDLPATVPFRYAHAERNYADGIWDLRSAGEEALNDQYIEREDFGLYWRKVGESVQIELKEFSTVRVIGGCQYWCGPNVPRSPTGYTGPRSFMYNYFDTRWAIRIAGTTYAETISGSQDWNTEGKFMERGYRGDFNAPYVETLIDLPPGRHEIELAYHITEHNITAAGAPDGVLGTVEFLNIGSFELFAMVLDR